MLTVLRKEINAKRNNRKDFNVDDFNFHTKLVCYTCTNLQNSFTSIAS